jgi:hypothetical protein
MIIIPIHAIHAWNLSQVFPIEFPMVWWFGPSRGGKCLPIFLVLTRTFPEGHRHSSLLLQNSRERKLRIHSREHLIDDSISSLDPLAWVLKGLVDTNVCNPNHITITPVIEALSLHWK